MGVTGSGKSSVGEALAPLVGARYFDGDNLHPPANIAKMSRGEPLTDEDRWPWLAKVGQTLASADDMVIVGCSALKRAYRDRIRDVAGDAVVFIHLAGSQSVIAARLHERRGHFMPPALLASQFASLEPPGPDERAIEVDIDQSFDAVIAEIAGKLERAQA